MSLDTLSLPLLDLFDAELDLRPTVQVYVFVVEDRLDKVVRSCTRKYADMAGDWLLSIRLKANGHPAHERRENSMVLVHVSGVQEAGSLHKPHIGGFDFAERADI